MFATVVLQNMEFKQPKQTNFTKKGLYKNDP